MRKGVIAGIIAVVALLAIGGVLAMNNKDNNRSSTSSTSTEDSSETSLAGDDAPNDTPAPASPQGNSTPPPAASSSTTVTIDGFAFSPREITVKKGTTVTWTNKDSVSHTVTGDNGGPASELFGSGESYTYTFNTAGTFSYHCEPHPQMTGKVTVVE